MSLRAELVESIFGYWPEFADGRIEFFSLDHQGILCLRIFYIDADIQKVATVGLRFTGVTDVDLAELRSENIVDALIVSSASPAIVTIEGCYGLCGTFKCISAEVTSVVEQ